MGLQAHGVAVLGTVQSGAPQLGLTGLSWSTLESLAPLAAVVALVVVTQTAATTRAFAEQGGYDVDAGRDFLAVGAGSVVAGLVGSFPVDASPPRTGAVVTAGGRTQAGALGAALVIVLLIPVADVLRDVPLATLAAILIFVALRLFKPGELLAIARFDLFEFGLAAVTLLAVVLIGVEQGIAVAVGLAILDRIRLSARPQLHVLGRIPGTTSWAPLAADVAGGRGPRRPRPLVRHAALVRQRRALPRRGHRRPRPVPRARGSSSSTRIGMSDVDFTGSRALGHVLDDCERQHVTFGVARAGDHAARNVAAQRPGAAHRREPLLLERRQAVTGLTAGPASPS